MSKTCHVLLFVSVLFVPAFAWAEVCLFREVALAELEEFDTLLPLPRTEKFQIEATHLPWGFPGRTRLLYHLDFIMSYDPVRRVPIWAAYRLQADDVVTATRRDSFRTDPRLQAHQAATCADYEEFIFDRGQLVSSADMNRNLAAQAYTFFLSNVAPQYALFNRRTWAHLEGLVRDWTRARGTIYVITGSVFDRDDDRRPDGLGDTKWMWPTRRVGVPSHFYKIVLHPTAEGLLETLSILLPHLNIDPPDDDAYLREHLVSIDEIESRTGLNFLPGLGPLTEETVERAVATDLWPTQ